MTMIIDMRTMRTPDERFDDLPDFDFTAHYADVPDGSGGTLRMAYVDEGSGPAVLLLHGEPSWSFLYRHVIRILAGAGFRAVAPDLVGFGRSDKPAEVADHTYARHVAWTTALVIDTLGLRDICLVGQDWGGLIGLRMLAAIPHRFASAVVANTGLPTGDAEMPQQWHRFRTSVRASASLDIARYVQSGCVTTLADDVRAAYDAPFPDESFKAGPRAMPDLVPIRPDDPASAANRAAWLVLRAWRKPFLVAFSDSDPITGPMAPRFTRLVPGARHRDHPVIAGAGHFLQEDAPDRFGDAILTFLGPAG
jgi:haloalkane dehalogenase